MPGTRPARRTVCRSARPSTLDDAVALRGYLSSLGVDWVYLSPLLPRPRAPTTATTSSIRPPSTRRAAAARRSSAPRRGFHDEGLGILVDIVPNHVGVARADENPWWWDLLTHGRASRWAAAFDIDWDFGGGKVRLPVLGEDIEQAAATGALRVDGGELRYYEHRFPLAPGSAPSEHEDVARGASRGSTTSSCRGGARPST